MLPLRMDWSVGGNAWQKLKEEGSMRYFHMVLLMAAVLLAGVSCKKELPEEEIYGTWERSEVQVGIKLKKEVAENPTLNGIKLQVEGILNGFAGNTLKSMTCEANNELQITVVDPSGQKEETVKGKYYYRADDQFKLETTVNGDAKLGMRMVFYGGLVGMQYVPKLSGDNLELRLAPGVANALLQILLRNGMLNSLLVKSQGKLMNDVMPKDDQAKSPDPKMFFGFVEDVEVTVSLRRMQ